MYNRYLIWVLWAHKHNYWEIFILNYSPQVSLWLKSLPDVGGDRFYAPISWRTCVEQIKRKLYRLKRSWLSPWTKNPKTPLVQVLLAGRGRRMQGESRKLWIRLENLFEICSIRYLTQRGNCVENSLGRVDQISLHSISKPSVVSTLIMIKRIDNDVAPLVQPGL